MIRTPSLSLWEDKIAAFMPPASKHSGLIVSTGGSTEPKLRSFPVIPFKHPINSMQIGIKPNSSF